MAGKLDSKFEADMEEEESEEEVQPESEEESEEQDSEEEASEEYEEEGDEEYDNEHDSKYEEGEGEEGEEYYEEGEGDYDEEYYEEGEEGEYYDEDGEYYDENGEYYEGEGEEYEGEEGEYYEEGEEGEEGEDQHESEDDNERTQRTEYTGDTTDYEEPVLYEGQEYNEEEYVIYTESSQATEYETVTDSQTEEEYTDSSGNQVVAPLRKQVAKPKPEKQQFLRRMTRREQAKKRLEEDDAAAMGEEEYLRNLFQRTTALEKRATKLTARQKRILERKKASEARKKKMEKDMAQQDASAENETVMGIGGVGDDRLSKKSGSSRGSKKSEIDRYDPNHDYGEYNLPEDEYTWVDTSYTVDPEAEYQIDLDIQDRIESGDQRVQQWERRLSAADTHGYVPGAGFDRVKLEMAKMKSSLEDEGFVKQKIVDFKDPIVEEIKPGRKRKYPPQRSGVFFEVYHKHWRDIVEIERRRRNATGRQSYVTQLAVLRHPLDFTKTGDPRLRNVDVEEPRLKAILEYINDNMSNAAKDLRAVLEEKAEKALPEVAYTVPDGVFDIIPMLKRRNVKEIAEVRQLLALMDTKEERIVQLLKKNYERVDAYGDYSMQCKGKVAKSKKKTKDEYIKAFQVMLSLERAKFGDINEHEFALGMSLWELKTGKRLDLGDVRPGMLMLIKDLKKRRSEREEEMKLRNMAASRIQSMFRRRANYKERQRLYNEHRRKEREKMQAVPLEMIMRKVRNFITYLKPGSDDVKQKAAVVIQQAYRRARARRQLAHIGIDFKFDQDQRDYIEPDIPAGIKPDDPRQKPTWKDVAGDVLRASELSARMTMYNFVAGALKLVVPDYNRHEVQYDDDSVVDDNVPVEDAIAGIKRVEKMEQGEEEVPEDLYFPDRDRMFQAYQQKKGMPLVSDSDGESSLP
eukprot:GFYU01005658.1.p1 GENE.GFYU01005658.1~~GFYU01005658.1.p1  ORF type:complete len:914 (-),score=324.00 GFYU01005658.1:201-2942(-)